MTYQGQEREGAEAIDLMLVTFDYGDFSTTSGTFETEIFFESGPGQCKNSTGEVLIIYGPKNSNDTSGFETSAYFLPPGITTPQGFDCDGIYLPNDRIANMATYTKPGPAAVKFVGAIGGGIRSFEIFRSGNTYDCSAGLAVYAPSQSRCPSDSAFPPTYVCWSIPNLSQAKVDEMFRQSRG